MATKKRVLFPEVWAKLPEVKLTRVIDRGAPLKRGIQVLGRLKVNQMNKTEAAYAALLEQRRTAGEVT